MRREIIAAHRQRAHRGHRDRGAGSVLFIAHFRGQLREECCSEHSFAPIFSKICRERKSKSVFFDVPQEEKKIKRETKIHTFEGGGGVPAFVHKKKKKKIKKKRETERTRWERRSEKSLSVHLYDAPRSIERTARGEERRKKKRDLNYFPKGFKSEILSETSLLLDFPGKTNVFEREI